MLSELDADFDRNLGEKIQLSTQIGNLRIPQVRSLLLCKLNDLRKNNVECRLEVLYPVENINMNMWDFVQCLGILMDNATEATLETESPWVEIILSFQSGHVILRVSNPYINLLEPGKMWNEGYPNTFSSATWDGGVFIQELAVEGRT